MKWIPKTRDEAIYRCGKERFKVVVIGQYDQELFPDTYWVQAEDLSLIDAARCQLRKIKPPETFFIARYPQSETIYPNGLSIPKMTLADAQKRPEAKEILEVVVVKKHTSIAPPIPTFLKRKENEGS